MCPKAQRAVPVRNIAMKAITKEELEALQTGNQGTMEPKGLDCILTALKIFRRLSGADGKIYCGEGYLLLDLDPTRVSEDEVDRLGSLGFQYDPNKEGFVCQSLPVRKA